MSIAAKLSRPNTEQAKTVKPWSLREIKDTRENLIESVKGAAFVPETAKAMLVETIEKEFPNSRLLRLDAHVHVSEQKERKVLSVAITIADL